MDKILRGKIERERVNNSPNFFNLNFIKTVAILFCVGFLFLGIATQAHAATYYVDDTGGNNSNLGTSTDQAWQNFTKLNATTFSAGDAILFKRGGTWTGRWSVLGNGTSESHITVGAYGSGAMPKWTNSGNYVLQMSGKSYWDFSDIWSEGGSGWYSNNSTNNTGTRLVFYNNATNGFYCDGTSTWTLDRITAIGNLRTGVGSAAAPSSITLKNSIVMGNATDTGGGINGNVTYSYSWIGGNGLNISKDIVSGAIDGGNNAVGSNPNFKTPPFPKGYVLFYIDDFDVSYATAVAAAITTDAKFSTFLVPMYHTNPAEWPAIIALRTAGNEVGNHTYNHNSLGAASLFTVTSTNTNPTFDVDVATTTITLSADEAGNIVAYNYSGDKTISDLRTAVSGKGWTITDTAHISDGEFLSSLADTSGAQAVGAGYAAVPDYNAFANNEIPRAITWMQSNLGFTPTSGAYPYSVYNATIQSWIAANTSLLGFRGGDQVGGGFLTSITTQNSPLFYVSADGIRSAAGGTTQANIEAEGKHDALYAIMHGRVFSALSHNTSEITAEQIGWYLDAAYNTGAQVTTHSDFLNYVRTNGSTVDNNVYTLTFPEPDLVPTNILLHGTGEGGSDIGALDYPTYTITSSAGANGAISPSGATSVAEGDNQSFTITPDAHYHVADVLVDDVSVGAVESYDFTNVTAGHTISVTFAIDTYTLTYTAGTNGSISGTMPQTVDYGADGTEVTATPDAHYHFVSWDDSTLTAARTDTTVTANHEYTATFAIDTYTLTYTAGANGSISGTSPQTINYGADGSAVTAVADSGYELSSWSDGSTDNPRTDTNVTANVSVTASFTATTPTTYTITPSAGSNGSINPSTATTVNSGDNQTFTITADSGYHVSDVLVDDVSVGAVSSYQFTNVTDNHTISATFAVTTTGGGGLPWFYITISAGKNGKITSPSGTWGTSFPYGSDQIFNITPDDGYKIEDVLVDGVSAGTQTSYTFKYINQSHSISATFSKIETPSETQDQNQEQVAIENMTPEQKQAKIQELIAKINELKQQIAQMQTLPSAIFTAPLYKGMTSSDVRRLQTLLATRPEIYPEGKITGYFGLLTKQAVQRFQFQYKLVNSKSDPAFGYVGIKTRAKLQEVFGNK
jgi:hypothetical protein